jgi:hypothetical protein
LADSQIPFPYSSATEQALKSAFTLPRLGKFLLKGGYEFPRVMDWYLWNARLIKSLQYPMHIAEVILRNAIVEHLKMHQAPAEWAFDAAFLSKLASRSPATRESLNKSKERLLREKMSPTDFRSKVKSVPYLDIPGFGLICTDDVVAKLPFEFWTGLLDKDFEADWHATLRVVFRNADGSVSRRDVWLLANDVRDLRNRMAHHEPIFHLPIEDHYNGILRLIALRCRETKHWVQHFSTFRMTLAQEPKLPVVAKDDDLSSAIRPVTIFNDLKIQIGDLMSALGMPKTPGVIVDDGSSYRLIVWNDIIAWLAASASSGIADLELPLNEFLSKFKLANRLEIVNSDLTKSQAGARFYARNIPSSKKPTALAVTDDGTYAGLLLGVVLKNDLPPTPL